MPPASSLRQNLHVQMPIVYKWNSSFTVETLMEDGSPFTWNDRSADCPLALVCQVPPIGCSGRCFEPDAAVILMPRPYGRKPGERDGQGTGSVTRSREGGKEPCSSVLFRL